MAFKIVAAEKEDCATILDFITQLAIYEKLEHEVVATVEKLENTLFGENPSAEVFFAVQNEKKVGFALIYSTYSTFLAQPGIHLEDLFVLEAHRGNGYGKKLLQFLADLTIKRSRGRLEWCVLDWNTPAIDFYDSLGAVQLNEWIINRVTGSALTKMANNA